MSASRTSKPPAAMPVEILRTSNPELHPFAILDAEQCPQPKATLDLLPPQSRGTLFSDKSTADFMQDVGPYLLALPAEPPELETLLKGAKPGAWLFLWSPMPFFGLLKAMTALFEIRSAAGEPGYLPFYRPENFHAIMKSRSPLVQRLFGVADVYCCPDEWRADAWLQYRLVDGKVCKQWVRTNDADR